MILKDEVRAVMKIIQKRPERVRKFFKGKQIAYAAKLMCFMLWLI